MPDPEKVNRPKERKGVYNPRKRLHRHKKQKPHTSPKH